MCVLWMWFLVGVGILFICFYWRFIVMFGIDLGIEYLFLFIICFWCFNDLWLWVLFFVVIFFCVFFCSFFVMFFFLNCFVDLIFFGIELLGFLVFFFFGYMFGNVIFWKCGFMVCLLNYLCSCVLINCVIFGMFWRWDWLFIRFWMEKLSL